MTVEMPLSLLLVVQVPLLVIWLYVLWDISGQNMTIGGKLLWAGACSIVWPVQIVYLLARPQRGRAERGARRRTRHARFVRAVLDRECGEVDRVTFVATVAQLVRHPSDMPDLTGRAEGPPAEGPSAEGPR